MNRGCAKKNFFKMLDLAELKFCIILGLPRICHGSSGLGGSGSGAVSGHLHAETGRAKWGWEADALTLLPKTVPSKPGVSPVNQTHFLFP